MAEYKISLDRKVLKLLGAQLYGDTPSVIAELVANSYDAYASHVWITVDTIRNNIIVEDDGRGMTANDINNSFLNIGYDRREADFAKPKRKVMGRKGIGKLAVFSLTNHLRVLSSKEHAVCGCKLDFNQITEHGKEPEAINTESISFKKDRLSMNGSGTRLELINVKKKISLCYRFIVSKLIRIFDVNYSDFEIYIRKDTNKYKKLKRLELNYFSTMDTIVTIGREYEDKLKLVRNNDIEEKYKSVITYDQLVDNQTRRTKNKLKKFPYELTVEDKNGKELNVNFSVSGWIGTVDSLHNLNKLSATMLEEHDEGETITVNDNRISLYARGKMGEYDILTKIKNNRNSEAYVIGELYVDIFEDDNLTDMAISNRRGYEESDNRYIETVKIAKRILGYIVSEKDKVTKIRKKDVEDEEAENIKSNFWSFKTKQILDQKLNDEEKNIIQDENLQFTRAINSSGSTKKIFISHRTEHKLYGQFIVDVLENYGVDVLSNVIFTSDRRLGVPQGRDIYDYLKMCFRDDLMVIFLFSKAFYDSNICVSEAGAAWATNKNCLNVIIDIEFSDIEKPSNNALSSIKFSNINTHEQRITLTEFFKTIILTLSMECDAAKMDKSINEVLKKPVYSDSNINNPELFCPTRKFLPYTICEECSNTMTLKKQKNGIVYRCSNVSCGRTYKVKIC